MLHRCGTRVALLLSHGPRARGSPIRSNVPSPGPCLHTPRHRRYALANSTGLQSITVPPTCCRSEWEERYTPTPAEVCLSRELGVPQSTVMLAAVQVGSVGSGDGCGLLVSGCLQPRLGARREGLRYKEDASTRLAMGMLFRLSDGRVPGGAPARQLHWGCVLTGVVRQCGP